jgi:hypothetical protein
MNIRPITSAISSMLGVSAASSGPVKLFTGTFVTWTLRARTVDDDPTTYPDQYRVPDDYHATTNYVIWVRSSLT